MRFEDVKIEWLQPADSIGPDGTGKRVTSKSAVDG
jgi:hypothetical protein